MLPKNYFRYHGYYSLEYKAPAGTFPPGSIAQQGIEGCKGQANAK